MEALTLHLAVEDQLERRVLDALGRTVDLIEEEDAGLGAGRVEPVRGSEGGDAGLLDAIVIGDADQVALGEEGEADVEEALAGPLGDRSRDRRLADAVGATEQDSVLDVLQDNVEGLEVDRVRRGHCVAPFFSCSVVQLVFPTNILVIPQPYSVCMGPFAVSALAWR